MTTKQHPNVPTINEIVRALNSRAKNSRIFQGFTDEELEIAQNFDVSKHLEDAIEQRRIAGMS